MKTQTASLKKILVLMALLILLNGCADRSGAKPEFRVLATTTIVADIVKGIAGSSIAVDVLIPVGSSPHGFQPSPRDIAKAADASLVFINGAGLEQFVGQMIANAGGSARVISLSDALPLRRFVEKGQIREEDHDHEGDEFDPHVWTDPANVLQWSEVIRDTLSRYRPEKAKEFERNFEIIAGQLTELDLWIKGLVAQLPPEKRRIVTDHVVFGYFSDRYGFEQVGAIFPGFSSLSEPSAKEMAALEKIIHDQKVSAIFIGNTMNPALAERIGKDAGVKVIPVYTGSLSMPDGEAGDYFRYTRYNVNAIVNALR
jgi:manganese/iron transport system substrate-binding protein